MAEFTLSGLPTIGAQSQPPDAEKWMELLRSAQPKNEMDLQLLLQQLKRKLAAPSGEINTELFKGAPAQGITPGASELRNSDAWTPSDMLQAPDWRQSAANFLGPMSPVAPLIPSAYDNLKQRFPELFGGDVPKMEDMGNAPKWAIPYLRSSAAAMPSGSAAPSTVPPVTGKGAIGATNSLSSPYLDKMIKAAMSEASSTSKGEKAKAAELANYKPYTPASQYDWLQQRLGQLKYPDRANMAVPESERRTMMADFFSRLGQRGKGGIGGALAAGTPEVLAGHSNRMNSLFNSQVGKYGADISNLNALLGARNADEAQKVLSDKSSLDRRLEQLGYSNSPKQHEILKNAYKDALASDTALKAAMAKLTAAALGSKGGSKPHELYNAYSGIEQRITQLQDQIAGGALDESHLAKAEEDLQFARKLRQSIEGMLRSMMVPAGTQ